MLEQLQRTVAAHAVRVMLCGCESCGHVWLAAEASGVPRRCSRCKARTWRGDASEEWEPEPQPAQPKPTYGAVQPPQPQPDPISVGAVRCSRCGRRFINSFGLSMHDCRP